MFPCTRCGVCCKTIGRLITEAINATDNQNPLIVEIRSFPFKVNGQTCSMFIEGEGCSVYNNRPDICNIDKMYEKYYKHTGMSLKEYYSYNAAGCNILIDESGTSHDLKVILK